VVEPHLTTRQSKVAVAPAHKAPACVEEARVMVLEVMASLVAYYGD